MKYHLRKVYVIAAAPLSQENNGPDQNRYYSATGTVVMGNEDAAKFSSFADAESFAKANRIPLDREVPYISSIQIP